VSDTGKLLVAVHPFATPGHKFVIASKLGNYKVNGSDTKEYVGRIQPDALKLRVERILAVGRDDFEEIVTFYLALRPR